MAVVSKPRVRRGSKNKKRNWKHCDISEVNEYLENKGFEERIGGPVCERKDEELFVLQTTTEDTPETAKKLGFPLKCHSYIGAFTKVKPPIIINQELYSKKIQKRQCKADKKRAKHAEANAAKEKKKSEKNVLRGDFFVSEMKDLWGDDEKVDPDVKDLILYRDEITRKRTPNVPSYRYQKPSLLPAVEIPHPGASYNPSYEDHQELLSEAVKIEEVKQRDELHLKRVLTDMFPTKAEAPTAESLLLEMSQGLFDEEANEEEDETEQPALSQYRNPPITPDNRIPKSRKRRKKERKEEERLKKVEKLRKLQMNKIYKLRSLKKEIKQEWEISEQRQDMRQQRKIDKMYKPLVLSKHKYEAPDMEVALSDELCESLRTLKAEGNILEDRYKSLQRRNLIEPRIKQKMKRKYKLKVQVKRSHRDFK